MHKFGKSGFMNYDFIVAKNPPDNRAEAEASRHAGYAFQFDEDAQAALPITFFQEDIGQSVLSRMKVCIFRANSCNTEGVFH
jgi:hypothetical protein